jgi:hypothetical protein
MHLRDCPGSGRPCAGGSSSASNRLIEMEAVTVAGRDRVWRAREAIASWGLGTWLLGLLLFSGLFAAFNNGATAIPEESRLQVGIAATGLVCGIGRRPARGWIALGLARCRAARCLRALECALCDLVRRSG